MTLRRQDAPDSRNIADGFCIESPDRQHCSHWWDCAPCCYCGYDGGGEDCDCERHRGKRAQEGNQQ